MRSLAQKLLLVLPLLALGGAASDCLVAQVDPKAAYQVKRAQAAELFNRGERLEALALLEELVKANPNDPEMLVALAACLIEHAATLKDPEAAGRERLRARDFLDRGVHLGNTSTLALNLAELLDKLPNSGAIQFSDNPAVEEAMQAGEAAFSRRDFTVAIQSYSKALVLDPKNYTAALFIGNTYDKEGRFDRAAAGYQRAIRLDPNIETAYRYYADMLAKQGNMREARVMLIHAAVAEPYNRMVWRELRAWATLANTRVNEIFVAVPAPAEDQPSGFHEPSEIAAAWQAYRDVRARWKRDGVEFHRHFPAEKEYRHSLPEEADALTSAALLLKKLSQDHRTAALVGTESSASLLLRLYDAGLIEPYVLFSLGDRGTSRDYAAYRAANRDKLAAYLDEFVVPRPGG
jgi:Flp pilus assembly protein TadD